MASISSLVSISRTNELDCGREVIQSSSGMCRKRCNDSSSACEDECNSPPTKIHYLYVLESKSDIPSEADTESFHSIQDKITDSAKDTSDTSTKSEDSDFVDSEYEVMSFDGNEQQNPFDQCDTLSSGTDTDIIGAVAISALCDKSEDIWADSSSISSQSNELDPELSPADFWTCVKCKNANNNPMFRYCEKCYKIRKTFFPPRPSGTKKRKFRTKKKKHSFVNSLSNGSHMTDNGIVNSSRVVEENSFENNDRTRVVMTENSVTQSSTSCDYSDYVVQASTSSDIVSSGNYSSEQKTLAVRSTTSKSDNVMLSLASSSGEQTASAYLSHKQTLCNICFENEKNGIFVHSRIGHIYSCYKCSLRVWRDNGRCPICNSKVSKVLKAIQV